MMYQIFGTSECSVEPLYSGNQGCSEVIDFTNVIDSRFIYDNSEADCNWISSLRYVTCLV